MPSFSFEFSGIHSAIVILYLCAVAVMILISIVGIAILYKNAEKRSVANAITFVYALLFLATFALSLRALTNA